MSATISGTKGTSVPAATGEMPTGNPAIYWVDMADTDALVRRMTPTQAARLLERYQPEPTDVFGALALTPDDGGEHFWLQNGASVETIDLAPLAPGWRVHLTNRRGSPVQIGAPGQPVSGGSFVPQIGGQTRIANNGTVTLLLKTEGTGKVLYATGLMSA